MHVHRKCMYIRISHLNHESVNLYKVDCSSFARSGLGQEENQKCLQMWDGCSPLRVCTLASPSIYSLSSGCCHPVVQATALEWAWLTSASQDLWGVCAHKSLCLPALMWAAHLRSCCASQTHREKAQLESRMLEPITATRAWCDTPD